MTNHACKAGGSAKSLLKGIAVLLFVMLGLASTAQAQSVDWLVNIDNFGADPVPAGTDIDYTIAVTNNGFDPAPATTISVDIPVNAQYIGATGTINGCVSVPASGVGPATVTCNVPALAGLGVESMVMTVRSSVEGTITTTATVPLVSGGINDINTANNVEPITSTILKGSDIGVTLTAPATAASGSVVPLVFEAINNGPNINDSFDLEFPVPTGISNITPPAGCVLTGSTYTCTITGPLAVGATVSRTFTGQISAGASSTVTPTVSVVNSAPGDPISSNNTDLANITITAGSDVSISKVRSPAGSLLVGDAATFTLGAQSTGDSPTGLQILDTIPANYQIDSITAPGWDCTASAGQTVDCTRATGAGAGADVSLGSVVIETTILSAGNPTNTATISSAGPVDSDLSNNSASDGGATIDEPVVDLSAVKTGPVPALAVTGQPYTYNIATSNLGNTPFFGTLTMADHVPAGMTVNAAALNGWTCDALPVSGATDLNCTRVYTSGAPLGVGATTPSITLTVEFTSTGTISNGLTVGSPNSNVTDVNPANDSTSYDVVITDPLSTNTADIGTIKTAAVDPIVAGDIQTYTLEITNAGPGASQNVGISDTLTGLINNSVGPTNAGYISHVLSNGVATGLACSTTASGANGRQLDCGITTLPVCTAGVDCPTITVQVRPGGNADPARSNTFNATSSTTPDPDLGNNGASTSFVVTALTDVTVSKTATPDPVAVGQNITYVVTATNVANGLSAADAVTITDTLPSDMTFISATPSAGSCSAAPVSGSVTSGVNNQVVCDLGTIGNGGQQTVTIIARPNFALRTQTISNDVVVTTTTPETDSTNNAASVDVTVEDPDVDILIEKSDSIDPLPVGDNTVYTLTITNAGPSASENVVVTDSMPTTRINYQSHIVSGGGTCSTVPAVGSLGGTLVCSWPYLEAGASETIQVTAGGVAKGSTTNTAVVGSTEITNGFDRNAGNNSTTETTTLRTKTDIEVTSKVPSVATVDLNEDFSFLATVHVNTGVGLAEADDVVFSDTLPAGMVLTGAPTVAVTAGTASSTTCTGASGATSFTCNLGTVSSNGTVEITIPVEVTSVNALPDTLTNTASVSTSSYEAPGDLPNNTNSGNITVGSSSISGTVFRDFADDSGITAGDTFVSGVPVTLTGTSFDGKTINITVNTNASGFYEFPFLPEGTYQISRGAVAEPYLTNGTNTAGSEGGTVTSPTLITAIALPAVTAGTDYLFPLIPQARVGIAKDVGSMTTNPDGSFNTTFNLVVENFSLEALDNMVVTDPLTGAAPLFGTYQALGTPATDPMTAGSYTMLAAPTGTCGSTVAGFDGSGNTTVATGFSLASGATCTLSISVRVQPTVPLPPVLASGGRYENQATVTGEGSISGQTSVTNPDLSDLSDDGTNPDPSGNGAASDAGEGDPTPVIPNIAPAIALVKTADTSALSSPPVVGDIITYTFAVTNTGNVNLTGVSVADPMPDILISGSPIAALAVGATNSTITATYALKLSDLDAGQVQNTATTEGTDPYGTVVNDDSGSNVGNDTPTVVPLTNGPAIALIKTADTSALQSPPQAGDIITYHFRVENIGNVTLTNVTITDPMLGGTVPGGPIASMAPGDVDTLTFSAPYALTLPDMAAGEVVNTATATGTPPTGPAVSDDSGTDNTNDDPLVVPLTQDPSILLEKFVDAAPHLAGSVVGDLVEYTFTVTNTGNIPLNNVMVTDALAGVTVSGGPIPVLNPGVADTTTFTATYYLVAADISAGEVVNDATVTGDYGPNNSLQVSDDDSATLQVGLIEAIPEVFPAFTTDGGTTTSMLDSDLLNNAQATLTNVNITVITTDPALTLDPATGLITLAPGNPAGPYQVTYEICSVAVPTLCDTTTETVTQGALPGIETQKTQVFTDNGDGRDDVGDTVTYTITVTNTGNTPLSGVTLADTLTDNNGGALALTTGPTFVSATASSPEGTLEIGEVATYTATFVLDLQAVNAGGVSNTATATGLPVYMPGVPGTPTPISDVSDDGIDTDGNMLDDPTVLVLAPSPVVSGLTMTKTTPNEIVLRGSVVPYTITINNAATHVAGPYNIVDTLPPGLIYVPNTATLDGVAATVTVSGAVITWPNVTVPASGQVVVTLDARVLNGANAGALINRVSLRDPASGDPALDDATALVRIMPEAVFDCVDVIGKVFDDVNGNGYQDAPGTAPNSAAITDQTYYGGKGGKLVVTPAPQNEDGIPGVRLVTVDGLVITTDEYGRYSVPCAALPADGGDNFIIKLDPRSLPTGYSMTTENPRVSRVTPGMMSEVNFGATLGHLARVDVNDAGFSADGTPVAALGAGLTQLAASLVDNPATVVIAYHLPMDADASVVATARQRMDGLKDQLRQAWRRVGRGPLNIQTLVMREGA